MGSRNPPP
ncbi:hypothetical protein LINGRAPRIM_LOCUS594 [Linum grandiflorum]